MNITQKRRSQNINSTKKNIKNVKNKNNFKYKSCKSKMYNSLY